MSEPDGDERLLERFLERRSEINRIYRDAADREPPHELDAAILAASREAASGRSRPKPWALRWGAPLAAAAVLALAVAISLQLRDQADQALDRAETSLPEAPRALPKSERLNPPREAEAPAETQRKSQSRDDAALRRTPSPVEPAQRERRESDIEDRLTTPSSQAAKEVQPAAGDAPGRASSSPEALLAQIREQYARGETGQADGALRQFCLDFPEYALPEELRSHAARLSSSCRQRPAEE